MNKLDPKSLRQPLADFEDNFYRILCSTVDSPRSLACYLLFSSGEHRQLLELRCDPKDYTDVNAFELDYLCTSLFSKSRDLSLDIDREQAAFRKWLDAEDRCRKTNESLAWTVGEGSVPSHRVVEIFDLARRKVRSILGDSVPYSLIREHCRFGPGSDMSTRGDNTSAYHKFATPGSSTPWVLPVLEDLFDDDQRQDYAHECQLVRGNRLSFVPKNATIDRAICTEPRWNVYVQLGIGEAISKRLKLVGVDLHDQNINRLGAKRALRDGLATIDLSSASDTVSKRLVQYLLPEEWCDVIFKSRSPSTFYQGKWYQLEKVSSMGNGYTFPLESLIFYVACDVACDISNSRKDICVFGDDLIVPQESVPTLLEILNLFGFSVNSDKSFWSGSFYESCGHDFFNGKNVRPFFLKKKVATIPDLYILANQIVDYSLKTNGYLGADSRFKPVWKYVVSKIPKSLRLFGPLGVSGVLAAPFDFALPARARSGWEGYVFDALVPMPVKKQVHQYRGLLFSKLVGGSFTRNWVSPRRRVMLVRKKVYTPVYRDFIWI